MSELENFVRDNSSIENFVRGDIENFVRDNDEKTARYRLIIRNHVFAFFRRRLA